MVNPLRNFDKKSSKKVISNGVKIDITQIPPEGATKTLKCLPSDLSFDSEEIEFTQPIQINAQLKREMSLVQVKGDVIINLKLKCSRCLEDFIKDFSYNLNLEFPVKKEDVFIDIAEDLRSEIILNHPFKILCKPDCKGLCLACGMNLNKGACNCKVNSVQ